MLLFSKRAAWEWMSVVAVAMGSCLFVHSPFIADKKERPACQGSSWACSVGGQNFFFLLHKHLLGTWSTKYGGILQQGS